MHSYSAPKKLLKDRVILVTGAGGAIGGAAALSYAKYGATVILLGRSEKTLNETYDAIVNAGYSKPMLCPLNLENATPGNYQALADSIEKEFGRLDGILHAAAMLGSLTPLEHYDLALWSRVMQINLNAPFLITRTCLNLLKAAENASVIFSAAGVGLKGEAYWGAYGVAHAAVENLAEIFADELESNTSIRINSLDPGLVRSRLRALAFPGEDPNTLPSADQIMPAYLYLMGNESIGITGERLLAQAQE
ncbi:MAG: YciK family oxidoreductase [Gammaproteobacteria bacterium]|nr:YciK family oxidoreductase [Gammaproteobacteria bacterium]